VWPFTPHNITCDGLERGWNAVLCRMTINAVPVSDVVGVHHRARHEEYVSYAALDVVLTMIIEFLLLEHSCLKRIAVFVLPSLVNNLC
jgi:hypothetical protein